MKHGKALILALMLAAGLSVGVFGAASFPSSVKSFTTKLAGDTVQASHINDLQDEVAAVETDLLNGFGHHLLFTDNTYDIGQSGATRPRHLYLAQNAVVGGTLAVTGASTLTGNTQVSGTFGSTGAATLSSTLNVTGATTLSSTLAVTGAITATAGQISFPASQNASAGANVLDDYEEGTFTPTDGSGAALSFTSVQTGSYTKVGNRVCIDFAITYPVTASGSNASIASMPFTAGANSTGLAVGYSDQGAGFTLLLNTAAATVFPYSLGGSRMTNANFSGKTIYASGCYRV
jgi:hypothetical protein